MIEGVRVTVTTTATPLFSAVDTRERGATAVTNRGAVAVHLGGPGVTSATGFQLDAAQTIILDVNTGAGDQLYGITASSTAVCHVLRSGR